MNQCKKLYLKKGLWTTWRNKFNKVAFYITLCEFFFFTAAFAIGLSLESKWQQVSSGLSSGFWLVISNAVVWMVTARPPIYSSSSPFTKPLETVPIIIGITVIFTFPNFFFVFVFFGQSIWHCFLWFSFGRLLLSWPNVRTLWIDMKFQENICNIMAEGFRFIYLAFRFS